MATLHSIGFVMAQPWPIGGSYYGERGHWLIATGQHRESDALDRSNFRVIVADLTARYPESTAVERATCSLVGWRERLLVDVADADARRAAEAWAERLEDYPVADDEDFSNLEYAEAPQCPDCHARHYTRNGEYDESRYHARCAVCKIRLHMIGHQVNRPHTTRDYILQIGTQRYQGTNTYGGRRDFPRYQPRMISPVTGERRSVAALNAAWGEIAI